MMYQVNKQLMKQKEDIDSSNKILFSLLSELEYLASSNKNRMFEHFLENKTKSKKQTIELINFKLTLFRIAYNKYIKEYGKYEFPVDLNLYNIIKIVEYWKYEVPSKYKSVYDHFLAILNNRPFNDDKDNYEVKNHINPKKLMENCVLNPVREKEIYNPNKLMNEIEEYEEYEYNPKLLYKQKDYNQKIGNLNYFQLNEEKYNYQKIKKDNYQNIFDSSNSIKLEIRCPCKYCRGEGPKIQCKCPKCSCNELINDQGKVICSGCGESKFIWKKKFKCGKYDKNYHDISYQGILFVLSSLGSEANPPTEFLKKLTKQIILHEDEFLSE